MNARVVVITDVRRFGDPIAHIGAILRAVPRGAVAVQVREKELDGRELLALVLRVVAVARPLGAEVWVNDRVDVAVAAGADGVHLPESGLSIEAARALSPRLRIGVSRHSAEAAVAAARAGTDVVQLGPCFATPGKSPIGLAPLAIGRSIAVPIVAVGGITSPETAAAAIAAGASTVAVIRSAWSADHASSAAAIATLVSAVAAAR